MHATLVQVSGCSDTRYELAPKWFQCTKYQVSMRNLYVLVGCFTSMHKTMAACQMLTMSLFAKLNIACIDQFSTRIPNLVLDLKLDTK